MGPRPGGKGVLGLPTYLWVSNASPSTLGPQSRSVTAAGITVTATAHVLRVEWDTGDGATVTCTGPGTPYQDSFGATRSPTCGHTYTAPGRYAVSATSYWQVDWTGAGDQGSYQFSFTTTAAPVVVTEVQALV